MASFFFQHNSQATFSEDRRQKNGKETTEKEIMGRRRGTSAFPSARIKKMMQADEDVGKIATVTPMLVAKALECMMEQVITETAHIALDRRSRTVTPLHLKACVMSNDNFDFLRPVFQEVHGTLDDSTVPRTSSPLTPQSSLPTSGPAASAPTRSASVSPVEDRASTSRPRTRSNAPSSSVSQAAHALMSMAPSRSPSPPQVPPSPPQKARSSRKRPRSLRMPVDDARQKRVAAACATLPALPALQPSSQPSKSSRTLPTTPKNPNRSTSVRSQRNNDQSKKQMAPQFSQEDSHARLPSSSPVDDDDDCLPHFTHPAPSDPIFAGTHSSRPSAVNEDDDEDYDDDDDGDNGMSLNAGTDSRNMDMAKMVGIEHPRVDSPPVSTSPKANRVSVRALLS